MIVNWGMPQPINFFDTIHVQKKDGVIAPRNYTDYDITVDESKIPEHVTCTRMI